MNDTQQRNALVLWPSSMLFVLLSDAPPHKAETSDHILPEAPLHKAGVCRR